MWPKQKWKQTAENTSAIKLSIILTLFLHINYPTAIKVLVQTGYKPMTYSVSVTVIGSILKFLEKGGSSK
jgi:hypothetical protein